MIQIEDLIDIAIEKDASDIHLVCGNKPLIRIIRKLEEIEKYNPLTEEDMYDIYDSIVKGNLDKDNLFKQTKKLDTSYEYKDIRLRINISLSNGIPLFTLRLIKKQLPKYADLGVPDIVRRMTMQPQGLILVTGKTNSGKTTTLNALVNEINEQLLYEKKVWTDVVAMAVEALSFYSDREDVAATIEHCINGLSKQQHKDGSYGNCESTAEVIIALTMADIDPITDDRFKKNGKNLGDGLMLFKGDKKYLHTVDQKESEANNMSTEKALLALASMKLQADGKKIY
jgi:hypothetical protein